MAHRFSEIITNTIDDINDDSKKLIIDLSTLPTETSTTLQFTQTNSTVITYPDISGTLILNSDNLLYTAEVVTVKNSNAGSREFTSIAAAADSILDSSSNKPYVIRVGPGIYTEPLITLPPYVSVVGDALSSTIVQPDGAHHIFLMGQVTELSFLQIRDAPSGYAGIACIDTGDYAQAHKIIISNCDTNVIVRSITQDTYCYLEYVEMDDIYTHGAIVDSNNGFYAFLNAENFYAYPKETTHLDHVVGSGLNWEIVMHTGIITGNGTDALIKLSGSGTANINAYNLVSGNYGMYVTDGATCELNSSTIHDCTTGVFTEATASTPNIELGNTDFVNNIRNIQLNNLNTTGNYIGYADYTKTFVNKTTPFFVQSIDPNEITVFTAGGNFTSIVSAINNVNIVLTCVINGTTTITSSGLFSPVLTYLTVTGTNIPPDTTATYIDDNTVTLSNAALSSGTITATFLRATSTNPFAIKIGSGVFNEPNSIIVPEYVNILGEGYKNTIIKPMGNFDCVISQKNTRVNELLISNVNSSKYALRINNGDFAHIDSVTITDCSQGIIVYNPQQLYAKTYIFNCTIIGTNSTTGIYVDSSGGGVSANVFIDNLTFYGNINNLLIADGPSAIVNVRNSNLYDFGSDTAFKLLNGSNVFVLGTRVEGWSTGFFTGDTILNNPRLEIIGCNIINSVNYNLNITNPSTRGYISGFTEYNKTVIHNLSAFFVTNKDSHVVFVAKKGGDFDNIYDAINVIKFTIAITTTNSSTTITSSGLFKASYNDSSITGSGIQGNTRLTFIDSNTMTMSNAATASASITAIISLATADNLYVIQVGPGVYIEQALTVPDYVSIFGSNSSTIINPQDVSGTLITMGYRTSIGNITINDVTNGIGLYIDSKTQVNTNDVIIKNCATCMKVTSTTGDCEVISNGVQLYGPFGIGIDVDGTLLNTIASVRLVTHDTYCEITSACIIYNSEGPNVGLGLNTTVIDGNNISGSFGVVIKDGGNLNVAAATFNDIATGITVLNVGDPPNLSINGLSIKSSSYNINIAHPGTTGVITSVTAERSKVFIDPSSTISVQYVDPVVNGNIQVGSLYLGRNNATVSDVVELLTEIPIMGVIYGGEITDASGAGFNIDISGGVGYLAIGNTPDQYLKKLVWTAQTLTLSSNSTEYIYFDSNGTLNGNPAKPSTIHNILLGRVRTDSSGIELIDIAPVKTYHEANTMDEYFRNIYGSVFASGSIVTANASRELAISSGKYYLSSNVYNPSGQSSPATFASYYHEGSILSYNKITNVTIIDNAQYDNGTNLVPLSSFVAVTITIDTTNTSTTISSSGAFYAGLNGLLITGLGVANGTHVTYVDVNTMTMSNAAIASGTGITAKFIVDTALTIGKTDLSDNITSTGVFTSGFIGSTVTGLGIAPSTTVVAIIDANNATISNAASGTGSISATFTIPNLYTKHSLFLVGEGVYEKYMMVYGQTSYTTLNAAQNGSLSNSPIYFNDGIVIIASAIVQDGSGSFIEIASERPLPSFKAASVTGALAHGNLLGLANDDHSQYLLVNGTRAMAGNLDLGAYSITNVNLVDGIDVSAHASRHLPNGADPLTTAAPLTNLSATTTNTIGTANSMARSDHTHVILTGTASTQTPDQSNAAGTSANLARADHVHNIATAAAVSVASTNAQGSASTFSKSDHVHQGVHSLNVNAGTQRFGDITIQQGDRMTITDSGAGIFTLASAANQIHFRYGTGAIGSTSTGITIAGTPPTAWNSSTTFVYRGSTANNGNPSRFGIIYTMTTSGTEFEARIFDVTNANTIATITNIGGPQTQYYIDTTTFANVPSGDAVFELQFRRTINPSNTLTLFAMYFEF